MLAVQTFCAERQGIMVKMCTKAHSCPSRPQKKCS